MGQNVIQETLRREMERILPARQVLYSEPMARHCSFRTGGAADALALVRTEGELCSLLALLRARGVPFFLLGKGTNLLIGDGGYRGVIVTAAPLAGTREAPAQQDGAGLREASARGEGAGPADGTPADAEGSAQGFPLDAVRVEGNFLTAGAGASLKAAALAAMEHGLAGLEFAAGIPGTVGGGLVMNAGAYGGEMKQVVRAVRLLMPDGAVRTCTCGEMEFGYRDSLLRRVPAAALMARLELVPGDPARIRAKIADLAAQRREKQPLEYPSAGSTFKRPEGHFAGKLVMDAGLRGYRVGDAQVSEKHCGFVINRGGATSAQIRQLIEDVQRKVYEDSGVRLEREVIYLGDFG